MTDPTPAAVRLTLPRSGLIGIALGGLVLVGVLATLIAVLVSLEGTRSEIRTTRARLGDVDTRVNRLVAQLDPLLTAAEPLAAPRTRRKVATLGRAVERLPGVADNVDELLRGLRAAPGSDCDQNLQTRPAIAAGQVGCLLSTVADVRALLVSQRALTARSVRIQLRTLGVTRETRGLTRDTLGVTRETRQLLVESLEIQRQLLSHATAIDRKIPGPTG